MTLPTTTPLSETLLPGIRPAADSKCVSKGNLLRKRFARWPIMKIAIIVTARATMTTIPTRKRRPTCSPATSHSLRQRGVDTRPARESHGAEVLGENGVPVGRGFLEGSRELE